MTDDEIVNAYVRYYLEGAEADCEAGPIELSQIAIDDPDRAWQIVLRINATPVEGEIWREHVRIPLGCGAIESLLVLLRDTRHTLGCRATVGLRAIAPLRHVAPREVQRTQPCLRVHRAKTC
jgi:hypothetical protein